MLAILALSRGGRRSRVWLQDALWGRGEKMEAQNNLRRELSSLRALLAPVLPDLLDVDRETVVLRLGLCEVDALRPTDGTSEGLLLEGLDIPGEDGFEEWLRAERSVRDAARSERPPRPLPIAAAPAGPAGDGRLVVRLRLEAWHNGAVDAMALPDLLQQSVITSLEETGCFRVVVDAASADGGAMAEAAELDVWIKTTAASDALAVTVLCTRIATRAVLVSMQSLFEFGPSLLSLSQELRGFAAQFVERLLHRGILSAEPEDAPSGARKRLLTAIGQMFSLNPRNLEASRATLMEATALGRQGLFYAWRAYQAVFVHDRAHTYACRMTLQECREDMRIALELDPYNGVSLSLCAHVEAFLFHDFVAAAELLERARATGTQHVMYHDALAMHRFYRGDLAGARAAALQAAALGRNLPFRYCFSTSLCMIEAMSGNLDAAVVYGRRALEQEPARKTISYPPTLRYLGAALAHLGRREEAAGVFKQLGNAHSGTWDPPTPLQNSCLPNPKSAEFICSGLSLSK